MCIICDKGDLTTISELYCFGCKELKELPELPDNIISINCGYTSLEKLYTLPKNLKSLYCIGCEKLTSLPILPVSLKYLDCSGCPLNNLPPLPISLDTLICIECPFKTLPKLPNFLRHLCCDGCVNLERLPELPINLEVLEYEGCPKLVRKPEPIVKLPKMDSDVLYNDLILFENEVPLRFLKFILYGNGANGKTTLLNALYERYNKKYPGLYGVEMKRAPMSQSGDCRHKLTNRKGHVLEIVETNIDFVELPEPLFHHGEFIIKFTENYREHNPETQGNLTIQEKVNELLEKRMLY